MSKISIRLDLEDTLAEKFNMIKEILGFKTNTSVLVHLINDAFDRNEKIVKPLKEEA